jgi:hypothetical protein
VAGHRKNALKVSIRLRELDCFGGHKIMGENLKGLHYLSVMQ